MSALIEAVDLAFGYTERPVGRHVSLSVVAGEVFALLGPNGCGKTTLFKTLLGLIPLQGGAVRIAEAPISGLSRADIARRIAYVPQTQGVAFPYAALDVVLMGRVAHRGVFAGPTVEDREAALAALDKLGIGHLAMRDVTRLSGGQRQLVLIARSLAQAAPLIVMDEPTASLDFGNQLIVLREIERLAEAGVGIILSTHEPSHALSAASRVALMREGGILALGPSREVVTSANLSVVYGVDIAIETTASGRAIAVPANS